MSARASGRGTVIRDLRQAGSLKLVFPAPRNGVLQGVLVNTAGGVTGGDRFAVAARAEAESTLCLTTQAAERAYRAQPGQVGRIDNTLHVEAGARLAWLPQETILFEGCALHRKTDIDLAADARLLFAEPLALGRAAMGEVLRDVVLRDRLRITRGGQPLLRDGVDMSGDAVRAMSGPATGGGAGAMALVVLVAAGAEALLPKVRKVLDGTAAGASLLASDVMVMRLLARDSFELRRTLVPLLTLLNSNSLPRPWMI